MRIAVFGLGYAGTVTAAGLAARGHHVSGVDVDDVDVDHINSGRSAVVEPGIDKLVATAVESGALTATIDTVVALDHADLSLICIDTPSLPQGGTDLTCLRRALPTWPLQPSVPPLRAELDFLRATTVVERQVRI